MPEVAIPLRVMIDHGAERLRLAGLSEPRRQAHRVWADLHGRGSAGAFLGRDLPVESQAASRYQRAIGRLALGEPLPHVTGWVGFRHLSLRIDARALIPRPETEGLVDVLLQRVRSGVVADVGTGTGCIALSLATEGAFSRIVAVDRSAAALALARLNCDLVGSASRVELVEADLCSPLRPGALDALVSNPPYLTAAEYASLDQSVRDWEPALALVSGEDGLEATFRLLDQGRRALRAGGWLAVEVDCSRAEVAAGRARAFGWEDVSVHTDLFGRERYLLARRSETR
jgi:release factor glutamine methyltransferase